MTLIPGLVSALGGCEVAISFIDNKSGAKEQNGQLKLVVLALMLCGQHNGSHHFAVIGEGRTIAMSKAGLQCLRDQGIEIDGV
jgi:hypothetical protein